MDNSIISAASNERGIGNGGTIEIVTDTVSLANNAQIRAGTKGQGNAKAIDITANRLELSDGSQLLTNTANEFDAGDITLKISDNLRLTGENTGLFANTELDSQGNGGSIFIDPKNLFLSDGAVIGVNSLGSGQGGSIELIADNLTLDNDSLITAETIANQGGDINLTLNDQLLLRNNSNISSTAGTAGAGGDGGNITISAPFIIAPPFENSDITANAFEGNGGNIDITSNGIFGIEFRAEPTPFSDITASSEFGLAGTVIINNPDVNPTSSLVKLPSQINDPSDKVIAGCAAASGNSFTISGRGGLPEDPTTTIRGQTVLSDLRDFTESQSKADLPPVKKQVRQELPEAIVQVNGWIVNQDGDVELVAALPQEGSFLKHPSCQDLLRQ